MIDAHADTVDTSVIRLVVCLEKISLMLVQKSDSKVINLSVQNVVS